MMIWQDYRDNLDVSLVNNWTNRWIPLQFAKMFNLPFNTTPGCYLYAYDETGEIETVVPDFLDPRVKYIGAAGERGVLRRSADFINSVVSASKQRDPETHAMIFRGIYRTTSLDNVYVAYNVQPWREAAFEKESNMLYDYEMKYGELPLLNRSHSKATVMIGTLIDSNIEDLSMVREFLAEFKGERPQGVLEGL